MKKDRLILLGSSIVILIGMTTNSCFPGFPPMLWVVSPTQGTTFVADPISHDYEIPVKFGGGAAYSHPTHYVRMNSCTLSRFLKGASW